MTIKTGLGPKQKAHKNQLKKKEFGEMQSNEYGNTNRFEIQIK